MCLVIEPPSFPKDLQFDGHIECFFPTFIYLNIPFFILLHNIARLVRYQYEQDWSDINISENGQISMSLIDKISM